MVFRKGIPLNLLCPKRNELHRPTNPLGMYVSPAYTAQIQKDAPVCQILAYSLTAESIRFPASAVDLTHPASVTGLGWRVDQVPPFLVDGAIILYHNWPRETPSTIRSTVLRQG
jgi:hypothetical protein